MFGRKEKQISIFNCKKDILVNKGNYLQRRTLTYDIEIEDTVTTSFGHIDVFSRLIDHRLNNIHHIINKPQAHYQ